MKTRGTMVLCAGGTGGHLFPAEALAHELARRGWEVHLATDDRAQRYAASFPAKKMHVIASSTPSGKNPFMLALAGLTLLRGYRQARLLLSSLKPAAVIGFGGYPTVPPMLAATRMGIPSMIHDANAVMGRANKLLAPRVDLVAMGFEGVEAGDNTLVTGNPVRPAVLEAAQTPYPSRQAGEPFNLLVFGGSQGAQFFSQAMPQAIELLPNETRALLRLVQQARPEDEAAVKAAYAALGVKAEVAPFFTDMAKRMANAHFVVSRAGASTVCELAAIGRPALLVPYPYALDHDQALNARTLTGRRQAIPT
jgi:UDP-N-acetylglucosamine--N-acetylmuramyl-(pentapeptide) pyrophosphoryl-undecaprenol N-acetylglucosamine transferase